jgi:chromosome partitioning protein
MEATPGESSMESEPGRYWMPINDIKRLCGLNVAELRAHLDSTCGLALGSQVSSVAPATVRTLLTSLGADYGRQVIAFTNLKGGVGKTVSATTIATRAAQYGFRVVLLDLDPQGSATLAFDAEPNDQDPIFIDIWSRAEELLVPSLVQLQDNLYLLPSSLDNGLLDATLASPVAQKSAVRNACDVLFQEDFDLVVIDCPPSLGAAVISTVSAANTVVIPVTSDSYAIKGLRLSLSEIRAICDTFGLPQPVIRVLLTRFDRREKLAHQAYQHLQEQYSDLLLPWVIPTSTQFSRALEQRETIFAISGSSVAKQQYDQLTCSLLAIEWSKNEVMS